MPEIRLADREFHLFQIVQVVSADGLSQFLIIISVFKEEDASLKLLIRAGLGTIFA